MIASGIGEGGRRMLARTVTSQSPFIPIPPRSDATTRNSRRIIVSVVCPLHTALASDTISRSPPITGEKLRGSAALRRLRHAPPGSSRVGRHVRGRSTANPCALERKQLLSRVPFQNLLAPIHQEAGAADGCTFAPLMSSHKIIHNSPNSAGMEARKTAFP